MTKVLIIGGAGRLGSKVVKELPSYLLLILEAAGSVIGVWGLLVRENYKKSMY